MWENATPVPPPQAGTGAHRRKKCGTGSEENLILWAQILISGLSVAVVFAAQILNWPFVPTLRTTWEKMMQEEQYVFLTEDRNLAKFTEQAMEVIAQKADSVRQHMGKMLDEQTSESRLAHGKSETVPSGAREESYLPDFSLCFPLEENTGYKTSGFGWRSDPMGGSGSDFHLGNDIAAAEGTLVLAAADGVVRYAGTHSSYGNYIRILHTDGDETLYAHLQYLFVHTGQPVRAGACLGTVGETGNATGPHLHFELLHKGIRYDPSEALQAAA